MAVDPTTSWDSVFGSQKHTYIKHQTSGSIWMYRVDGWRKTKERNKDIYQLDNCIPGSKAAFMLKSSSSWGDHAYHEGFQKSPIYWTQSSCWGVNSIWTRWFSVSWWRIMDFRQPGVYLSWWSRISQISWQRSKQTPICGKTLWMLFDNSCKVWR